MGIVNGTDLMVFIGEKSIAYATNHTLSISAETQETSTKTKDNTGGAWSTSKVTNFSWTITSENLYSTDKNKGQTYNYLFDTMKTGTPVDIKFSVKSESAIDVPEGGWTPVSAATTNDIFSGQVIITSLELNAPDGDNASYTVELKGVGELTRQKGL